MKNIEFNSETDYDLMAPVKHKGREVGRVTSSVRDGRGYKITAEVNDDFHDNVVMQSKPQCSMGYIPR